MRVDEAGILRDGAGETRGRTRVQVGVKRNSMKTARATAPGGLKRGGGRADPLGPNSEIGRKLKQYYDDLISESVPDKFNDLLKQLEERERTPAPAGVSDRE